MGYVYSEVLERMGRIDDKGYMYDEGIRRLGRIDFGSGYIYAENLSRIGRIDKSGYIYDEGNRRHGHIEKDGYVYNEGGRRVGRIEKDVVTKLFGESGPTQGCFLTSACVEARGLSDDCYELMVLRKFRDGYMRETPTGERDIYEYYRVAPAIVENIRKKDNVAEIFDKIYEELVVPCVELIENGDNEIAYGIYRRAVKKLQVFFIEGCNGGETCTVE